MKVKAVFHKKAIACGDCGKELPPGRSFYLPRWREGGGAHLCGRCGMDEMKRASKPKNDVGVVQEDIDLSLE